METTEPLRPVQDFTYDEIDPVIAEFVGQAHVNGLDDAGAEMEADCPVAAEIARTLEDALVADGQEMDDAKLVANGSVVGARAALAWVEARSQATKKAGALEKAKSISRDVAARAVAQVLAMLHHGGLQSTSNKIQDGNPAIAHLVEELNDQLKDADVNDLLHKPIAYGAAIGLGSLTVGLEAQANDTSETKETAA